MYRNKRALLLDMNSTFMFGEDRFSANEDYSKYYKQIGGSLEKSAVNALINQLVAYLEARYPDETFRENFPSVETALKAISHGHISEKEITRLIQTFSFHEHGYIPEDYIKALFTLKKRYTLAIVIDIWAPKDRWLHTFEQLNIKDLFSALSFSSDHGMVKPSPKPFELIVNELGIPKAQCLIIGDSVRRDLGGARAAGIDCVLVGGASDATALASYANLLDFSKIATTSE